MVRAALAGGESGPEQEPEETPEHITRERAMYSSVRHSLKYWSISEWVKSGQNTWLRQTQTSDTSVMSDPKPPENDPSPSSLTTCGPAMVNVWSNNDEISGASGQK